MNADLTPEEDVAVQKVLSTGKWDFLLGWGTILLPCGIIVGIGVWQDSCMVMLAGILTLVFILTHSVMRQIQRNEQLKSAVKKLKEKAIANQPPQGSSQKLAP